ncbi:MAG: hypothetical protein ACT4PN_18200 [Nitrospiraceae bacterium]
MIEVPFATIGFVVLAMIEGFNGIGLAFRTKRTLESAGLIHTDGPGLLVQEFGVYCLGLAVAYAIAAFDPVRFWCVALIGITINLAAGTMHLLRSYGVYFGGARPMLSQVFERKAGFVHTFALVVAWFIS